ncbi:MAG: MurR/RpiR family transcriptional regulator [Angelakisella sp.]|nr:MurR/RpiR family transcriptional regulator [Angelakisella sp.]MCI9529751.1 MurR/RpiR family transcriptional regulator [Angelakisella sp.]
MPMDLLAVIERKMPTFSKGQKLIGRFITQHYDKAAFMTASRLGDTVGVSESTVVRFATEVGFEGYPQLQKNLQEIIRNRLTTVQRMDIIDGQIGGEDILSSVLSRVLTQDSEKIRRTLEETDRAAFAQAVEAIVTAREVYILGIRSSSMLASFLAFYFNQIFPHVRCINSNSTSETFEQMFRIGKEDVFIPISFPRYSQRTLKAARYAKSRGATVIAITDSTSAPLAQAADILLLARSEMASFVDSLVAPLSVINALIVAVGLRKKDEITRTYATLESIWEEYQVYEKTEGPEEKQGS